MSHLKNSVQVRVPHLAAIAGAALLISGVSAFAQDAKPAAAPAAPAAAAGSQSPWVKQCGQDPQLKKQVCQTSQPLAAETGQLIARIQLQKVEGDPKVTAIAFVLTNVRVEVGVQMQVDQNKPIVLRYVMCNQEICVAQGDLDDAYLAAMKKGTRLQVASLSAQGKPFLFPFPLTGFKKVFEGPGLDPAAAKAKMNDLQQRLQQSADENRKKLIEQQNKELGTTPATGQ